MHLKRPLKMIVKNSLAKTGLDFMVQLPPKPAVFEGVRRPLRPKGLAHWQIESWPVRCPNIALCKWATLDDPI
jgi:hypothetical protein